MGKPADIYAIGLIVYELLAHRHAFSETSGNLPPKNEVRMHHVHAVPTPLVASVAGFTQKSLSDFVARMLAKAPEERPTAGEVYDVLLEEFGLYSTAVPWPTLALVLLAVPAVAAATAALTPGGPAPPPPTAARPDGAILYL